MKSSQNQQIEDYFQKFLASRAKKKTRFGRNFEAYKPVIVSTLLFATFILFVSTIFYLGNTLNQTFFYEDVRIESKNKANKAADQKSTPLCQHTIQGKQLITDSEGFVCKRRDINTITRCCKTQERSDIDRYSCNSCNETLSCCSVYEFCISCCMHPETYSSIRKHYDNERLFGSASVNNSPHTPANSLLASESSFEYCQAACRTNSKSILHLNKYKNEETKYCFGIEAAPLPIKSASNEFSNVSDTNDDSTSEEESKERIHPSNLHGDSGYDDMNEDASHRFNIVLGQRESSAASMLPYWCTFSLALVLFIM